MKKKLLLMGCYVICCLLSSAYAQDKSVEQLMNEQNRQDDSLRTTLTMATFESSRLIQGHSAETTKKQSLDFRISHRFDLMNGGIYDFFGLDNASIRLGFDYGITDRLTIGVGRSTLYKEYDIPVTFKILRQSSGRKNMPVTLTALGEMMINTLKDPSNETSFNERVSTAFQLLAARKFSNRISIQLMPIWVHYVRTPLPGGPNDIFSIGLGASIKLFKRIRMNAEYYPLFAGDRLTGTTSPLSVGFDIQTGGHVFQIFVSNAIGTNEGLLVTQTIDRWDKGQLHLGFNILRVFSF